MAVLAPAAVLGARVEPRLLPAGVEGAGGPRGRGSYLGGLGEFQQHASKYYDIAPSTEEGVEREVKRERGVGGEVVK